MIARAFLLYTLWFLLGPIVLAQECDERGLSVQVLGSGGPQLDGGRASSSYLIWIDGKARVLVDVGTGSTLRFRQSGARVADLDVVLLSHLHVDHTGDLPGLVVSSGEDGRKRALPIYGPAGNRYMPSSVSFVRALFDSKRGAFRYLGDFLDPLSSHTYKLQPHNVHARVKPVNSVLKQVETVQGSVFGNKRLSVSAASVIHGNVPAIAWRVDVQDKRIVFTGDARGDTGNLERLAQGADLLVAHHAVAENDAGPSRQVHMPPSVIGRIAYLAKTNHLLLSHRTAQTLGREKLSTEFIRTRYSGLLSFANDLDCFEP